MFRPLAAAATVAAALLATGCGAEETGDVPAETYAQTVCTGLVGWRDGIAADSAELSRSLSRAADVGTVRARHTRFFAGAVRRTDRLLGTVRDAGAPDADQGLGHARDLTAALDRTRAGLVAAQKRFAALPTADLTRYAAGARGVRDSLGTLFAQVGTTVDDLAGTYTDSGLNRAYRDQPACQRLTGA